VSDLDLLTVGRVNLDLYAQQTGVEFKAVRGWDAMVGGSPTNVAIAAARLGLDAAVLTAVGRDPVGDWVLAALASEGLDTAFVTRKDGPHTSLALRAQLPPEHTLAFFRQDPADVHLTAEDTAAAMAASVRAVLISADALARGSTPGVCWEILEAAQKKGALTFLDLDLRETNWRDLATYAATVRPIVGEAAVVLGTEEEFAALLELTDSGDSLIAEVEAQLGVGDRQVIVVKQGRHGATVLSGGRRHVVPVFPTPEASSIGAGDAFAGGLIYALLAGEDWPGASNFASACAAITVGRFGCSTGFPQLQEVERFLDRHSEGERVQ
jgi:5-dehydro-2-deoxygluconokinase